MLRSLFYIALAAISLAACSSSRASSEKTTYRIYAGQTDKAGDPSGLVSRQVKVRPFTRLEASSGIRIEYTCTGSAQPKVTVRAPQEVIDLVSVDVTDGTLSIGFVSSARNINIYGTTVRVSGPALEDIDLSSAAQLFLQNNMHGDGDLSVDLSSASLLSWTGWMSYSGKIDLDVSSAATIQGNDLSCNALNLEASSASSVYLKQDVEVSGPGKTEIDCSSASKVKFASLKCQSIGIETTSTSSCEIAGIDCQRLRAEASSLGKVALSGKCYRAFLSTSTSAKIDASNVRANRTTAEASSSGRIDAPQCQTLSYEHSSNGKVHWQNVREVNSQNDDDSDD